MPAGVAPAGRGVGEPGSSVRLPPPLTAKAPTDEILLSLTYRNRPSGLTPGSTAPTPPLAETWVLPSSVRAPPGGDRVPRDGARPGVDLEQVAAVGADRDPARCRLLVSDR